MIRVSQPELLFVYRTFGLNRELTALLSSNFMSDYLKYILNKIVKVEDYLSTN